jgi:hypothetical protein
MRVMGWSALLLAVAALSCRTPPLESLDGGALPADGSRRDAALSSSEVVSCGAGRSCAISAGEHCCDRSPLECQTAPCTDANQFDCDGPEDCAGGLCCFPIRNALSRARCAPACADGTVLCHALADCPAGSFCCLNFVLGPDVGLCLGACD